MILMTLINHKVIMASIEKTFKSINHYLDTNAIINLRKDWEEIQKLIVDKSNYKCSCGTFWLNKTYISDIYSICAKCDTYISPYLSNPINWTSVTKYIDQRHWRYIFPIYQIFESLDNKDDIFKYINKTTTPRGVFILYKKIENNNLVIKLCKQDGTLCREMPSNEQFNITTPEDSILYNFINSNEDFKIFKYSHYL